MIVRLISSIVALVIIAFFAGFNLENKCDVNLLFYTFKDAPVFFTVVFSFVAGVIFTIPFAFFFRTKKKGNGKAEKNPSGNAKGGSGTGKESGKGLFSRFNGKKSEKKSATNDDVKTDNAPEEKSSFESVQPAPENSAPETQY